MSIEIEAMREAHWPDVAAIWWEGIATGNATFTAEPLASFTAFSEGKIPVGNLVALDGGTVRGWTSLSRISSRPVYAGVGEIGIYVAAAARGSGVGRALMTALIARSEAAGVWMLQAGIFPENAASLALHERFGFRVVGRRERLGRMPNGGAWRDVMLLERRSATVGV